MKSRFYLLEDDVHESWAFINLRQLVRYNFKSVFFFGGSLNLPVLNTPWSSPSSLISFVSWSHVDISGHSHHNAEAGNSYEIKIPSAGEISLAVPNTISRTCGIWGGQLPSELDSLGDMNHSLQYKSNIFEERKRFMCERSSSIYAGHVRCLYQCTQTVTDLKGTVR